MVRAEARIRFTQLPATDHSRLFGMDLRTTF
jgi:hypothetical protein